MKNMKLCIILLLLFFDCHSALEYFDSENPFDLEQLTPINLIEGFYNNEDIISLDCTYSLASILFYNQTKDPLSHLRLIDSWGRLPGINHGFLEGNVVDLGVYDECIGISVDSDTIQVPVLPLPITTPAFKGQFMLIKIKPVIPDATSSEINKNIKEKLLSAGGGPILSQIIYEKILVKDEVPDLPISEIIQQALIFGKPQFGVCLPSTCNVENFENYINKTISDYLNGAFYAEIGGYHYTSASRPWTAGDTITLVILVIIMLFAIVGTLMDLYVNEDDGSRNQVAFRFCLCFSIYTNGKKLLGTKKVEGNIDCLNGIRFFSMCWVVLGHTFYVISLTPWSNSLEVDYAFGDVGLMTVWSGTLSVDTFFLLSGFLMSYLSLREMEKRKNAITIQSIPLQYLHRYIRLTPAYGLIMLLLSTLLLHFGSGPLWNFMDVESQKCQESWWTNILYINNFVNLDSLCMGESWYLAADFQLFLIGPWIMIILSKLRMPLAKYLFLALLMAISCAIPGILTGIKKWPPQLFATILDASWQNDFYYKAYTRSTPYIYGIIFGYICHQSRNIHRVHGKKLPVWLVILGWLFSTGLCLTTVFGLQKYWKWDINCLAPNSECYSMIVAILYASFGRLAFAVGVSWIIFASITGYAGFIGSFLSYDLFAPLSRLTYCMYLIHIHILFAFHSHLKEAWRFDKYLMIYLYFGHLAVTTALAFIASLLFESPFIGLERLIFRRAPRKKIENIHKQALENGTASGTHESKTNDDEEEDDDETDKKTKL